MMATASNSQGNPSLSTLTGSLTAAITSFPATDEALLPPADGISLLDTKNELLLSYMHHLASLVVFSLRSRGSNHTESQQLSICTIRKLNELRIYMVRGVRPLEGRLKYQIEKVLRAADDSNRKSAARVDGCDQKRHSKTTIHSISDVPGSGSGTSDFEAIPESGCAQPDDLSYRPNPAALIRKTSRGDADKRPRPISHKNATYKPPRITSTTMPTPATSTARSTLSRRERQSHLLDEYVSAEFSSAPVSEPSVGSNNTILNRGRGSLSARGREKQQERLDYEERNLARLPGESKAEQRKARLRGEGVGKRNQYGGEDWTGLGEVGHRIARSVGTGVGKGDRIGVLERRARRRRENGDDGGGGGLGIGGAFEKKRRIMEARAEKKGRKLR